MSLFREEIASRYESLDIGEEITVDELRERLISDLSMASLILGDYRSFTIISRQSGEILHSSDPAWQDASRQAQFRTAIFQSVNLLAVLDGEAEGVHAGATRTRMQSLGDFYDYVRVQPTASGEVLLFFKYSRDRALAVLNNLQPHDFHQPCRRPDCRARHRVGAFKDHHQTHQGYHAQG